MSNMTDSFQKGDPAYLARRYGSERRFQIYGAAALAISVLFLVYLIVDIGTKAWPSFFEHRVVLQINLDPGKVDSTDVRKAILPDWSRMAFVRYFQTSRNARTKRNWWHFYRWVRLTIFGIKRLPIPPS